MTEHIPGLSIACLVRINGLLVTQAEMELSIYRRDDFPIPSFRYFFTTVQLSQSYYYIFSNSGKEKSS